MPGRRFNQQQIAKKLEDALDWLRKGKSRSGAAKSAGITRQTLANHEKNDPKYAALVQEAFDEGTEYLEDAAVKRAVEGVEEPLYHAGERVLEPILNADGTHALSKDGARRWKPAFKLRYSDSMLAMQLNGRAPEKYRERKEILHTGTVTVRERLDAGRKRVEAIRLVSQDGEAVEG